jgi:hypothetical protein
VALHGMADSRIGIALLRRNPSLPQPVFWGMMSK